METSGVMLFHTTQSIFVVVQFPSLVVVHFLDWLFVHDVLDLLEGQWSLEQIPTHIQNLTVVRFGTSCWQAAVRVTAQAP